jgi:ParB-like chromosome segregation protein Spo0J
VQVEIVPIGSLTLNPNTVNAHPDEQINELAASLNEFGQQSPLVVRHDGIVLRGNGMLKAARKLGMTDIAIVRSELVGTHALGYAVADNRLGEKSQRDSAKLLSALEGLVDDVPLEPLGFNHDEIDRLSDEVQELLLTIDTSKVVLEKVGEGPLPELAWDSLGVPLQEPGAIDATIRSMAEFPGVIREPALSGGGR